MEITQEEYIQALDNASKWMMRAKVAAALATYFCEVSNYRGAVVDIKWEIELQSDRLLKQLHETEDGPKRVREELEKLKHVA